ncbi:hypothetical protein KAJ27_21885, partial [bacterium]|nr:hypothetical protein [bacterium]
MKKIFKLLLVTCVLYGACMVNIVLAEDPNYLKAEINELSRKMAPVSNDVVRMQKFMRSYDSQLVSIQNAYHQIDNLKQKLITIRRNNLLKVGMAAFIKIVNLAFSGVGSAGNTIGMLIFNVVNEVGWEIATNKYDSAYNRSVTGLNTYAQDAYLDIKAIQVKLNTSIIGWKEYKTSQDSSSNMGDTEAIFNKIQEIIADINTLKPKISKIKKALVKSHREFEQALPELKKLMEQYRLRDKDLNTRLKIALAEHLKNIVDLSLEKAKIESEKGKIADKPLAITGIYKPDLIAWNKKFRKVSELLSEKLPPLVAYLKKERKKFNEDYIKEIKLLKEAGIIYGNPPYRLTSLYNNSGGEMNKNLKLDEIMEGFKDLSKSLDKLKANNSDIVDAVDYFKKTEEKVIEVFANEAIYKSYINMARALDEEYRKIIYERSKNHVAISYNSGVFPLLCKLVPGFVGFDINAIGISHISMIAKMNDMLETADSNSTANLTAISQQLPKMRSMFKTKKRDLMKKFSELMEILTNCKNAFLHMEDALIGYDRLMAGSGIAMKARSLGEGSYYYSKRRGGLSPLYQYLFNQEKLKRVLNSPMEKDDYSSAEKVFQKYQDLKNKFNELDRKYHAGRIHFYTYANQCSDTDYNLINGELYRASQVQGTILSFDKPDIKKLSSLRQSTLPFKKTFSTLESLPKIQNSGGINEVNLFKLWKEARNLNVKALTKKQFEEKMVSMSKSLLELQNKGASKQAVVTVKNVLNEISEKYYAGNAPRETDGDEPKKPADNDPDEPQTKSGYKLLNVRLN